jgi:hypothetical protein
MTQKYNHKQLVGNGHGLQETTIRHYSKKGYFPHFRISEIRVHLTFDGAYELMLKKLYFMAKAQGKSSCP